MKPGWFNYETVIQSFRDFIKAKPLEDGKKYCIILDNAPWHKKAIRLIWKEKLEEYQDIRESMTYINLPPYSPDLNPIEQVWRITRREKTHNRYFPSLNVIAEVLDDFFGTCVQGEAQLAVQTQAVVFIYCFGHSLSPPPFLLFMTMCL